MLLEQVDSCIELIDASVVDGALAIHLLVDDADFLFQVCVFFANVLYDFVFLLDDRSEIVGPVIAYVLLEFLPQEHVVAGITLDLDEVAHSFDVVMTLRATVELNFAKRTFFLILSAIEAQMVEQVRYFILLEALVLILLIFLFFFVLFQLSVDLLLSL